MGDSDEARFLDERLLVLRTLRLKGRLSVESAELFVPGKGRLVIESLVRDELAQCSGAAVKPTRAGRDKLEEWLAVERSRIDRAGLEERYEEFDGPNRRLKSIVTAWQQLPDGTPNPHGNQSYDDAIVRDLAALHADSLPLLERFRAIVPRLWHYPRRLGRAVGSVSEGDTTHVASPLKDSYHQVWFELHEDLIGLLGRTRAEEAEAGRAL
ncbi:MAG TPA: hypothetical protein VNG12_13300 [Acidimicrobiales bacterium]|nr:hypothetical protein [Acidimicrobiales bacterium]